MSLRPSFSILTLGCRANQADSEHLRQILLGSGLEERAVGEKVDYAIVNTCTVTAEADRKSRQMLRRQGKLASRVIATGCGIAPRGGLSKQGGAFLRLPPQERESILELLEADGCPGGNIVDKLPKQKRTRALLKVQEGCDHFCSYCIVPYVRGRSRSFPVQELVEKARLLEEQGYAEIVLTGIHLAMWGRELEGEQDLSDLVQALISATQQVRLRISSIEPMSFPRRLLDLMAQYPQRLCPHLHLALQHASNDVLKRMRRDYTCEQYAQLAQEFLSKAPGGVLTTDVLVGFPGETIEDMQLLLDFLPTLPFYHLHVFPYSPRSGTAAIHFPDQIPEQVKKARVEAVVALGEELKQRVRAAFRGTKRPVLLEKEISPGLLSGTADNFITVTFSGSPEQLGHIVQVEL